MKKLFIIYITLLITFLQSNICYSQIALAAGVYNSFMSCSESSVLYSCGSTNIGQYPIQSIIPDTVLGLNGISFLSSIIDADAEYSHVLALTNNGNVWAWGEGTWGQLGDSTNSPYEQYPVVVKGENGNGTLDSVKAIAVGYYHSVFLMKDGTVLTCGYNTYGQLGDNSTSHRNYLQKVHGVLNVGFLSSITAISAGSHHCLALKSDSTVLSWGDGTLTPVVVAGLSEVVAISANGEFNLALKSNGTVWSWGDNSYGQLGTGNYTNYSTPVQVVGVNGIGFMDSVIAIAAGDQHSFAIRSNKNVFSWGYNFYGQLGDGTAINRNTPVQVLGIGGVGFLSNVTKIKAGGQHNVCSLNDGRVIGWGRNSSGELGDSTWINRAFPILIPLPCFSSGIYDINESQIIFKLYPNPFSDVITCEVNSNKLFEMVLYDITSREIFKKSFTNTVAVNTEQLAKGIYIYEVRNKNGVVQNGKVVKE